MTIRQLVKIKLITTTVVGLLGWFIFSMSFFINHSYKWSLELIGIILFAGSIVYLLGFIRCPKCKAPLGGILSTYGYSRKDKYNINHCPNCGIEMDSNYEH